MNAIINITNRKKRDAVVTSQITHEKEDDDGDFD